MIRRKAFLFLFIATFTLSYAKNGYHQRFRYLPLCSCEPRHDYLMDLRNIFNSNIVFKHRCPSGMHCVNESYEHHKRHHKHHKDQTHEKDKGKKHSFSSRILK
uniref:Uncharacterized protein n=1 Tax=Acrobeloides nanus TaxID=290746 RepID=A0A914C523_9BILA